MRLFWSTAAIVASLTIFANGSPTTYKVIATTEKGQSMGVIVDGKTYPLQQAKDTPVLHTGSAPSGSYSYAKIDHHQGIVEKETYHRQTTHLDETPNEFYNRTWNTQRPLTDLPNLLDPLPSINRVDSDLHSKDQIPTIYLTGDQAQIDQMHLNTSVKIKVPVDMHFIKTDKITIIKGIELKLSGRSSKSVDKLSYNIETPKDQPLFGYRRLKLRSLRKDPSYIREYVCYDLMHAMGLPASRASYVRVIMNNQPIGLFLMIEPYKSNWYDNEFGGGSSGGGDDDDDNKQVYNGHGVTYQGVVGSDLSYKGNDIANYEKTYKVENKASKKYGGKKAADYKQIVDFTKFLSEAPTTSANASQIWNQHIDMESVIRSLVVEIVGGFTDGYIGNSNNFFLYDNVAEHRLTYLQADFDTTVGNTWFTLDDMWSGNYTRYPGFTLRPLTQKLIQVPEFKHRFETLLHTVAKALIHDTVIRPRIDDVVHLIREDVAWDGTLPRVSHYYRNSNLKSVNDISRHVKTRVPRTNLHAFLDYYTRQNIDLETAVYKPVSSEHMSLAGVTQWFSKQSHALQTYFAKYPPSSS